MKTSTVRLITIIDSCKTVEQLKSAGRYTVLARNAELDDAKHMAMDSAMNHLYRTDAKYEDIAKYVSDKIDAADDLKS